MNKKLEVYKIVNKINNKLYVGITNQGINMRFRHHVYEAKTNSLFPLHMAMRKYGEDNFEVSLIEQCKTIEELKEREKFWIKELQSRADKNGYNLTDGGDGTFGRETSKETREKLRQKALGRRASEETKLKMSKSRKGLKPSQSKVEHLRNNAKKQRKPILQFTLNDEFIKEFESINQAVIELNIDRRNISGCLSGKRKSSLGYKWKYKEIV